MPASTAPPSDSPMKPLEKCVTSAVTRSPACVDGSSSYSLGLPFFVQKMTSFEPPAVIARISIFTGFENSRPSGSNL